MFVLVPNFTMIAFINAVEVLRLANQVTGCKQFEWTVCSPEGGDVIASNQISIETASIDAVGRPDVAFICAGNEVHHLTSPSMLFHVRRLAATGVHLGGLCTGTYVLAKAGVLGGYACAIHWEYLAAQREEFRNTVFESKLFVLDRDRVTCAGGMASLDLMLRLIEPMVTREQKDDILTRLMTQSIRTERSTRLPPGVPRVGKSAEVITRAIEVIEDHMEDPISCAELAERVRVSQRHLQRLFRSTFGQGIKEYYLFQRLRQANALLSHSAMSITDVSVACGFQSFVHFSRSFRGRFGVTPSSFRRTTSG